MSMNAKNSYKESGLLLGIGGALFLRLGISAVLSLDGFFIGQAADSFLRAERAWNWANKPFFITSPPIWPPFQYVIDGIAYWLFSPITERSHLSIPIAINQVFFAGSIAIIFLISSRIAGKIGAFIASGIAAFMAYDVWIGLSVMSEPFLIFFSLSLGYVIYLYEEDRKSIYLYLMGLIALFLTATHYAGWFLAIPSYLIPLVNIAMYKYRHQRSSLTKASVWSLFIASVFPIAWIFSSYIKFEDPFAIIRWTSSTHQAFSWIPIGERILSVPLAAFDAAPILSLSMLFVIPVGLIVKPRLKYFLLPFIPHILLLTMASILLLAPTRLIPRATLPFLWASIPFMVVTLMQLPALFKQGKYLIVLIVIAIFSHNFIRSFEYSNRISNDLRTMANMLAERILETGSTVIVNELPWTEQHALSVLSLYPQHIEFLPPAELKEKIAYSSSNPEIFVVSDPRLISSIASDAKMETFQGDYVFLQGIQEKVEGLPLRFEESEWSSSGENPFLFQMVDGSTALGFRSKATHQGSEVRATRLFELPANSCRLLELEIRDYSVNLSDPWQYLHQIVANNIVIWSYDPSADSFYGWKDLAIYVMPAQKELDLSIRILAVSHPEEDGDWWNGSQLAFRNFSLRNCP